ncbi:NAD-dependent epimerase/dehydratase family protein [Insolitispirillum peregrinum]|uniref:Nucleoside-diphosphate-sugar epimerase n=1 Tax=Insolitispirillum peregrinum TaxID=80876 RepID=A0A1N7P8P7_9PROT|nr:SDR family oxidoreductase [Insolitispirillum peregrinum]SIT07015.1 Nucleoside-diphosphate-sugar epimerase [Insolitispirillum peregrinum]
METVLVTGAGGYIGTTLVPMLLEKGYRVRALDRFFFGRELLAAHENLEMIQEDARFVSPAHLEGIDHVIDLVAISNDPSGDAFEKETYEINHLARANTARLAKAAGVKRYILPSSCSIYGFQEPGVIASETTPTNPLTTYAKANELAEKDVLPLASSDFTVIVLRQATVYGYSPRMRFDLAINGMTFGAWKTGALPLMRDGSQWRPMVHVKDTARAQIFMLTAPADKVNGQLFNVGSEKNNYQIGPLAEKVAAVVPRDVQIEWYGDVDHRSYRVSFDKLHALGYQALYEAEDGVRELVEALEAGKTDRTTKTITLEWYKQLIAWHEQIRALELHGGMLKI